MTNLFKTWFPFMLRRKLPEPVLMIRSLEDLCAFFGARDAINLNRRVFMDTKCGASISVQTPDGKWHHNGQDWSQVSEVIAFTIQTIVEGCDREVNSDPFMLPVLESCLEAWLENMEAQASTIWEEANSYSPGEDDEPFTVEPDEETR